ncbi:MAG: hypothetical protein ACE5PO_04205 [Candidatus Bathyarchaeia archaeon]
MSIEAKHKVAVINPPTPVRVPKEKAEQLRGIVKGNLLKKMKTEAVECPVVVRTVAFLECFSCPNFMHRVKGEVHCKGLPL